MKTAFVAAALMILSSVMQTPEPGPGISIWFLPFYIGFGMIIGRIAGGVSHC